MSIRTIARAALGSLLRLSIVAAVVFAAALPTRAQDDSATKDPRRALERFQEYLEKKPYHDWAFDKLVESAVQLNQLKEVVAGYEKRLETDKENRPARVVLGRLQARGGDVDKGLETLRAVPAPEAGLWKLIGELELKRNKPKQAIEALDQAAASTKDRETLKSVFKLAGEAHLAAGERAAAAQSLAKLAELDPTSFGARLEVATSLAQHGLAEEALTQFGEAEKLAGDDNQKRCQVLSEIGRLHEVRLEIDKALASYRSADRLMTRGNWLKKDLAERVLALHKRGGTIDAYVAELVARETEHPEDVDAREMHAQALREQGKKAEAADVLAAAVAAFPDDLKLSRARIALLGELGRLDEKVAEYQRTITKHPEEFELYLELGTAFAESGKLEQARLQWQKTLEQKLVDPALCGRIAELYAGYGMRAEAQSMYERAIGLEPKEIARYADLATFLAADEAKNENSAAAAKSVIERAETAAGNDATRLEQVATLWRERGEKERALTLIERALVTKKDDARTLAQLADLQIELGRTKEALDTLHAVVEHADEGTLRHASIDRVVRVARKDKSIQELTAREKKAIANGTKEVAPFLVLGRIQTQDRDAAGAIATYEALLASHADQEDAHKELARLVEDQGDLQAALAHYQRLAAVSPKNRRPWQKEIARIHLALFEQDEAFQVYREMLQGSPDNPAAFKEVADAYQRLNLVSEAIECMLQAVRLKPDDGRYRLQLARLYQSADERDKAQVEIVAAIRSKEEDVRDEARKHYYDFLASEGLLDREIDTLRRRVEDNPYDLEASLTLTDIYSRELEYELALDMLEKNLRVQPKDKGLLEERARILGLMDRHREAIADWETLDKLPGSDRAEVALKIAEAAIQAGDIERATRAGEALKDRFKLARLYQRHGLFEQAMAMMKLAVAASPNDVRLLMRMSDLAQKLGDKKGAAEALERALAVGGEDTRTLMALGTLYHDLSRKEDVLDVGRRLFALARVPEKEKSDAEKQEDEEDAAQNGGRQYSTGFSAGRSYYYGGNTAGQRGDQADPQYEEALNRISEYFESKGLHAEFAEIGAAEVRLQPSNSPLFWRVVSSFEDDPKSSAKVIELIGFVRAATVDQEKTPRGVSPARWREALEKQRIETLQKDSATAAARADELQKKVSANTALESDFVELAQIQKFRRADAESQATLAEGAKRFPKSAQISTGIAQQAAAANDWENAARAWLRTIELLTPDPWAADKSAEEARAFKEAKNEILTSFPVHVRPRVTAEHLKRMFALMNYTEEECDFGVGRRQSESGARTALAHALLKLGKRDEALQALKPLAPKDDHDLRGLMRFAYAYYREELFPEARAVFLEIEALRDELERDPVLGHSENWTWTFQQPMQDLARIDERSGDLLAAYDRLRTYGDVRSCELILTTKNLFADATARYESAMKDARAKLAVNKDDRDARFALRDAGIKHAEILQFQKRWPDALAAWRELSAELPEEWSLRNVAAAVLERLERYDEAIAEQFAIIDAKRASAQQNAAKLLQPKRRELTPEMPPRAEGGTDSWIWNSLRSNWNARPGRPSVNENYVAILRILLDRRETSKAAEVMRRLAREDAQTFSWMGWELGQLITNYRLGADGVPILRLLVGYNTGDENMQLQYGDALVEAQRFDEAERTFTALLAKSRVDSYYKDRAQEKLDALEKRAGRAKSQGLDALKAAVASDPKNVKQRVKYARALLKERRYEEACDEATAARALAPHQDDVQLLVEDCWGKLGRWKDIEGLLKKKFDEAARGDDKFVLGIRLANARWADGDEKGARELLESEEMSFVPGSSNGSVSGWYLQRGLYADALRIAVRDLAAAGQQQGWRTEGIKGRLAKLQLLAGEIGPTLDDAFQKLEAATGPGEKSSAFSALVGTLRQVRDPDTLRARIVETAGAGQTMRQRLARAAASLAARDLATAESEIGALIHDEPEALFLYPTWIGLARARQDFDTALERMRAIEPKINGAQDRLVWTSVGRISERDSFHAEMGSLLLALGKKDEAIALWQKILDPTKPETQGALAQIFREHRLFEQALAMQKTYLEKQGERNAQQVELVGDLELELGHVDLAIAAYERAQILSSSDASSRTGVRKKIVATYRRAGRTQEALAAYKERAAADASDLELQLFLADLSSEVGDEKGAIEALQRAVGRAGYETTVLPLLADRQLALGDTQAAEATFQRLLASNMREWSRGPVGQRLGELCLARGDTAGAIEAVKKGQKDPDAPEAMRARAAFCEAHSLWSEVVDLDTKALDVDPKDAEMLLGRARALEELGRNAEALEDVFRAAREPSLAGSRARVQPILLRLVDAVSKGSASDGAGTKSAEPIDVAAQIARDHAAKPGDVEITYKAALLADARGDFEKARPLWGSIVGLEPASMRAHFGLALCARVQRRWADAQRSLETLLDLYSREDLHGRNFWNEPNTIRRELTEIHLAAGDTAAAIQAASRPIGLRSADVDTWTYSYDNAPQSDRDEAANTLAAHGLDAEALALFDESAVVGSFNRYGDQSYLLALARTGKRERAREIAWWQIDDPSAEFASNVSSRGYFFAGEDSGSATNVTALLRLHRESGEVDRLVEKLRAELARQKDSDSLSAALRGVLAAEERWTDLLAECERALAKTPDDATILRQKSQSLIGLKRFADALAIEERLALADASATGAGPRIYRSSTAGSSNSVRFNWGSTSQNFGGSWTSYSEASATLARTRRPRMMALSFAAGNLEAARRFEEQEKSASRGKPGLEIALARATAEFDLVEPTTRFCQAAIQADARANADEAWDILVALHTRLGRDADRKNAVLERSRVYAADVARDPYNVALLLARARFLVRENVDLETAEKDLAKVRELDPLSPNALYVATILEARRGRASEALARAEEASKQARLAGDLGDADLDFARGFALASAGKLDEAKVALRAGVAATPTSDFAREAKALLK